MHIGLALGVAGNDLAADGVLIGEEIRGPHTRVPGDASHSGFLDGAARGGSAQRLGERDAIAISHLIGVHPELASITRGGRSLQVPDEQVTLGASNSGDLVAFETTERSRQEVLCIEWIGFGGGRGGSAQLQGVTRGRCGGDGFTEIADR